MRDHHYFCDITVIIQTFQTETVHTQIRLLLNQSVWSGWIGQSDQGPFYLQFRLYQVYGETTLLKFKDYYSNFSDFFSVFSVYLQ